MVELNPKGVHMQVSAISMCDSVGYNLKANLPYYHNKPTEDDTSFNSLTPYWISKPNENKDSSAQLFRNINKWQTFCQDQVMGKKLNVIA